MTYIGRYTPRPRIMNPSGPLPEVRFTQTECLRNWLPPHTHDPPHTRLTGEVCPVRVSEVRSSSPCFLLRSADTRRGCRLIAGNCQLRVLQMGLSKNRTPGLCSEDAANIPMTRYISVRHVFQQSWHSSGFSDSGDTPGKMGTHAQKNCMTICVPNFLFFVWYLNAACNMLNVTSLCTKKTT